MVNNRNAKSQSKTCNESPPKSIGSKKAMDLEVRTTFGIIS